MTSLTARTFQWFLRTTGQITKQFSGGPGMLKVIEGSRALPTPEPSDKVRRRLTVSSEQFQGRTVWHIAPRDNPPRGRLLYLHGGGYVFTAAPPHWNSLADFAERFGIAVTAPLYPLAPESDALGTTGWALDYYRHYLTGNDAPFIVGGDSAGGGLASATAMAARDAGLRLPGGLLLICPWLDVTASHAGQPAIEPRDCVLTLRGIRDAGTLYRGGVAADDWRVSPIHGDWSGLPPVLMFGGGDDILVTDARALKAKLPSAEYEERAGLMHDWPIFFFPESRAARAKMGQWIASLS